MNMPYLGVLESIREGLTVILLLTGSFFCFTAGLGVLRFPDIYTRLHANTKGLTAGSVFILLASALNLGSLGATLKVFLVIIFFLLSNPIATHAVARASYRRRIALPALIIDEYRQATLDD